MQIAPLGLFTNLYVYILRYKNYNNCMCSETMHVNKQWPAAWAIRKIFDTLKEDKRN